MSAASKPEEAGPECFAQFGVDWAPVQVGSLQINIIGGGFNLCNN